MMRGMSGIEICSGDMAPLQGLVFRVDGKNRGDAPACHMAPRWGLVVFGR